MIQQFVARFDANRDALLAKFKSGHPQNYLAIVKAAIEAITTDRSGECAPDPERIHQIDDGHYQGTLVFIIPEKGYQPSTYYAVLVDYGSCSGCDTLEAISGDGLRESVTDGQAGDYLTLALHVVQGIRDISSASTCGSEGS